MSKQEEALQHWESARHRDNIELLLKQATNYMYPASQATAGLQLATVEVPWLLAEIARLEAINVVSAPALGLHAQAV